MKEHLEKDFGNSCSSLVRSIVQRIEGGTVSQPIISQAPDTSRCGPEDNDKAAAAPPLKCTPHILINRNPVATTHHNGSHSVTDPGSANTRVRSDDQSSCRRLSLSDTSKSENTHMEKKFRSTENLINTRPAGKQTTSRPTSAANSIALGSLSARSGRTTDLKDSGHRRDSETGASITSKSRSRSIDRPTSSSGSVPRSRSVEARSRTPLRSSVNVGSGPTPSAFRTSCTPVPAAVVCDAVADKQVVVLSRTVAKRQSLTTTESSSIVPDRKGLQKKLSSGRLGITADKLLPNYQPKRKLQTSVSFDASSVVDCGCGVERGDLRRSSSLHESATMPLLTVTFEDYPEPPPPEEDLNARMELLFEEYRRVELGLIFKKTQPEEPQEPKESVKKSSVERGRRRASIDRCSPVVSSAQNPRVRSVSLDRSVPTESRTSQKDMHRVVTPRSDPVQSDARDSRTPTKKLGLGQENSKTRIGSARLSTTRRSSSCVLATVPICPSDLTKSAVTQTQASRMPTKTPEDLRNQSNKSSDNNLHNQTGKQKIQSSSSEQRVPTRDPSVTRNLRRSSTTDLSSRMMEGRSGTIATGNTRRSRDTSSRNVTKKHIAATTDSQHTSRDVPQRNILDNPRTIPPDLTTVPVRKPKETVTGSGKPDIRNKQLNGNNGDKHVANVVPTADSEKSAEHGVEEKGVIDSTKAATSKDERASSRSKIPVPINSKRFSSGSQRSLKRCDSGVDIANNYKPETDSVGLRMGQDEESKSNTPLILNDVSSRMICAGRTAKNCTPPNIEDEYY